MRTIKHEGKKPHIGFRLGNSLNTENRAILFIFVAI